jgi:hypothetical protein
MSILVLVPVKSPGSPNSMLEEQLYVYCQKTHEMMDLVQ